MNGGAYLAHLKSQLKGFSPEEQAQLIEEIAAHIESGEKDPGLGSDEAARAQRLEKELGSPEDLGRRLQQVHRPKRWLDYFLVVLPTVLIFPLMPLLASLVSGMPSSLTWIGFRLMICVQAILVLVSRWKASPGVLIHWMSSISLIITGLLLSEVPWPWKPASVAAKDALPVPEMVFWLAALIVLLAWLAGVVRAQRSEPLLVILAVLPFLYAAANYAAVLTLVQHQIDSINPSLGWFGLFQVASFLWPALFFLPNLRDLRWAGLLVLPVTYLVYYLWPYRAYPLVAALYLVPAVLVVFFWVRDVRARLVPATH